ncbi:MAG: hypothetical protein WBA76_10440 [Phormidesmis sp.]
MTRIMRTVRSDGGDHPAITHRKHATPYALSVSAVEPVGRVAIALRVTR